MFSKYLMLIVSTRVRKSNVFSINLIDIEENARKMRGVISYASSSFASISLLDKVAAVIPVRDRLLDN